MEFACDILGHARSRHRTHVVDGVTMSRCRRCLVDMVRGDNGRWRAVDDTPRGGRTQPAE